MTSDTQQRYYDNLEQIQKHFPGKHVLTKQEVQQYTGQCYRKVCQIYPFRGNYISIASLARSLV